MKTHLTWSLETVNGHCPTCASVTVLLIARTWQLAECTDDGGDQFPDVGEEVSIHWCRKCEKTTSLSLNT